MLRSADRAERAARHRAGRLQTVPSRTNTDPGISAGRNRSAVACAHAVPRPAGNQHAVVVGQEQRPCGRCAARSTCSCRPLETTVDGCRFRPRQIRVPLLPPAISTRPSISVVADAPLRGIWIGDVVIETVPVSGRTSRRSASTPSAPVPPAMSTGRRPVAPPRGRCGAGSSSPPASNVPEDGSNSSRSASEGRRRCRPRPARDRLRAVSPCGRARRQELSGAA